MWSIAMNEISMFFQRGRHTMLFDEFGDILLLRLGTFSAGEGGTERDERLTARRPGEPFSMNCRFMKRPKFSTSRCPLQSRFISVHVTGWR